VSGALWVLRDQHGTLVGASVERRTDCDGVLVGDGPFAAIANAFGTCSARDAAKGLTRAVENGTDDRYEYAGYTLALVGAPLSPDDALTRAVARVMAVVGCGDHSCLFTKPSGVGTNGGCRCGRGNRIVLASLAQLYHSALGAAGA
jgi:hypothetical protein